MPMTEYAAEGGTAIDEAPSAPAQAEPPIHDQEISEIAAIELGDIVPSPFNPRKNYSEASMAELVESVRRVGVLEPVLVRPRGGTNMHGRPIFELVFGHRRWQAAQKAEQASLPAMVRSLTDSQSAQLQAVENLHREDLTALDEAQGYAAYLAAHGISKDDLAARIGKSRTHVYQRLKLAELVPEVAQALQDGRIRTEIATRIARIPPKHQPSALRVAMERDSESSRQHSYRRASEELIEKFSLDLKTALFDTSDAALVDLAGACTTCPKRSGMTPELYGDMVANDANGWRKGNANVCTDPDCFAEKKKQHLKLRAKELEAKGATVVQGSAARAAIDASGNVKGNYVALADVKADLARIAKESAAKAKAGLDVPPAPTIVTIQDPRGGKTVQAVKVADLKGAGVKVAEKSKANDWEARNKSHLAEQKKRVAAAAARTAVNRALLDQVRAAACARQRSAFDLQLVAQVAWQGVDWRGKELLGVLHGFKNESELGRQIGQMGLELLGRFCLDCALVDGVKASEHGSVHLPEPLLAATKHYGIELPDQYKPKASAKGKKKGKGASTPEEALAAALGDEEADDEGDDA